jgi:hypothetical protein
MIYLMILIIYHKYYLYIYLVKIVFRKAKTTVKKGKGSRCILENLLYLRRFNMFSDSYLHRWLIRMLRFSLMEENQGRSRYGIA